MVDRSELTVVAEALERAAKSVSAHSLASYERRWRQWVGFAEHFDLNLLPADPVDVAAFVVARHRNSVSSATISANLSAIDWMHRQAGVDGVCEHAKAVARSLAKVAPSAPVTPAAVVSVGALRAMASLPPGGGTVFSTRLVRSAAGSLRPRQLLTVTGKDVRFDADWSSAELVIAGVPKVARHPSLAATTLVLEADPGWVACPVRALRQLVAEFGDGPLFSQQRLARVSGKSVRSDEVSEGTFARQQVRDTAIICVGYAGALRVEELSRARVEHLELLPNGFVLRLPEAKTTSAVPYQSVFLRESEGVLDPVSALHRWLAVRGDHDGPLFIPVHHQSSTRWEEAPDMRMPAGDIRESIQRLADRVGLPPGVSGYSLRRSWATHRYLEDPSSLELVSIQLRHSGIEMTARYIDDLRPALVDPSALLGDAVAVSATSARTRAKKNLAFSTEPLGELRAAANELIHAKAVFKPNTLRTRASHWSNWERFCDKHRFNAFAPTDESLAMFVAHEVQRGVVAHYLHAQVRSVIRVTTENGSEVAGGTETAIELLDAYARAGGNVGRGKAPTLSYTELCLIGAHFASSPKTARHLVTVAFGYCGALRVDDLRRARIEDVEVHDWGTVLRLRASKDNQSGRRAETVIMPKRKDVLDPSAAFLALCDASGLSEGPLVPTSVGAPHPSSYDAIVYWWQKAAAHTGTTSPTGHSMRRSWATHAFESGVDVLTIQRHLRHSDTSDTRGYIASLTPWVENAAQELADQILAPVAERDLPAWEQTQ